MNAYCKLETSAEQKQLKDISQSGGRRMAHYCVFVCVCVYDYYSCEVAMIQRSQLGCEQCAQPLLPFLIY